MMQKLGLTLLVLVAVVAISGMIIQIQNSVTGGYVTGSGCGRWYCGPQKAQLAPDEACIYAGLQPVYPVQVYTDQYGGVLSLCKQGNYFVGVPVVQTIYVS